MSKNIINVWYKDHPVWTPVEVPSEWSFGKCIYIAEIIRANSSEGTQAYVEGDLIGELAAKVGISRAAAEIEYQRPEWAA